MDDPLQSTAGRAGPRLRLALLVDSFDLATWQREVVTHLRTGGDTDLVLVVLNDSGTRRASPTRAKWLDSRLLWRLYNNRWVARRSRAVRIVSCTDLFETAEVLRATPVRKDKFSRHLTDDVLRHIAAADVDVMLRFGFGILRGEILDLPRLGVWSFHHDDERVIRGGPPGFWEVADGLSTTGVLLQRLTERLDGGIPLARATFKTSLRSYPSNRDRTALGSAVLPAACARAARLGTLDWSIGPSTSEVPIRRDPSNGEMLTFLSRQATRALSGPVRSLARGQRWQVGILDNDTHPVDPFADRAGADIQWFEDEIEHGYLADPFPHRRSGRYATMVEQFDESTARGVISAIEHRDGGDVVHVGVIDPGVHASYPYLLEHDGELYCVPETWQLGRVDAWRAIEFPTRWERHCTVLEGVPLLDPTIFNWQGRWWLFGTRKDHFPNEMLHAWYSSNPLGPWTAHPLNPIKIDVTSSRPAGTPFIHQGVLYRPAQDCATGYGAAVVLNRVVSLDPARFAETPVHRFGPEALMGAGDRGTPFDGVHTMSRGGGRVAIDARTPVIDRYRIRREITARLRSRLAHGRVLE